MLDFNEKSVLITGGSRGLGRALALRLSAEGAKVALVARHQAELDETVSEIRRHGGTAFGIVADVGDKESVYPIVGQAAALAGPVDILINNASTLGPVPLRLIPDTDCEDFERALQVNTIGPFRLIKAVVGSMILRQTGVIVNISSDAAVEALSVLGRVRRFQGRARSSDPDCGPGAGGYRACVSSASTRARWTHGCTPTRCPTPIPAVYSHPDAIAEKIVIDDSAIRSELTRIASGTRLIASDWKASYESSTRASRR